MKTIVICLSNESLTELNEANLVDVVGEDRVKFHLQDGDDTFELTGVIVHEDYLPARGAVACVEDNEYAPHGADDDDDDDGDDDVEEEEEESEDE